MTTQAINIETLLTNFFPTEKNTDSLESDFSNGNLSWMKFVVGKYKVSGTVNYPDTEERSKLKSIFPTLKEVDSGVANNGKVYLHTSEIQPNIFKCVFISVHPQNPDVIAVSDTTIEYFDTLGFPPNDLEFLRKFVSKVV